MAGLFESIKHLLPNAVALRITTEKQLREFWQGLGASGDEVRTFYDEIFSDIDPQQTRQLSEWEQQFNLPSTQLTEQERRDRLDAEWKASGGQDPSYIQATLRAAGFNVWVHEWWVPGSNPPVPRNPFTYLDDGSSGFTSLMVDGAADAQDGDLAVAMDGATASPIGYPLVNKITETTNLVIGDGSGDMQDGDPLAADGTALYTRKQKQYIIPADVTKYPFFFYIGGETFSDQAFVVNSRRDEFENLCLKICPTEQWLGILVTYS